MSSQHVFRVDRFNVPNSARTEFLKRVTDTHRLLARQKGFVRDYVLEQSAGPDEFNLVTLAEWESQQDIDEARDAIAELHRQLGFDPREIFGRLGIRAELGNYRPLNGLGAT